MSAENIEFLLARRATVQGWITAAGQHEPAEYVRRLYNELAEIDKQLGSKHVFTDVTESAPQPFEVISRVTT